MLQKFPWTCLDPQAPAQMARGMVGCTRPLPLEHGSGQLEASIDKRTEVDDFVRKLMGLDLQTRLLLQEEGIVLFEVGATGGAEGEYKVNLIGVYGSNIVSGHLHGGFFFPDHEQGQAATALICGKVDLDAVLGEKAYRLDQLLGVDEILQAAGKQTNPVSGAGERDLHLGPLVPKGLGSQGGQGLEIMFLADNKVGQVPEIRAFLHRLLPQLPGPKQPVEQPAVGEDRGQPGVHHRSAALALDQALDLFDQPWQVNTGYTDILAGLAAEAVLDQVGVCLQAVKEVGQNQTDGSDIDVPVLVSADQAVDGADIGAGPAAHAAQGLGKDRILGQSPAAVVQKDHVHLLVSSRSGGAFDRSADPGHVGGDGLAGGVSGKPVQDGQGVVQTGQELVHTEKGYMHPGQGGHQTSVSFIGDQTQGAAFGYGEVGPAHAHVRVHKALPELPAGYFDQTFNVGALLFVRDPGEQVADLLPGEMDGRHDHVGRAFVPELDNPFPEIGLGHGQSVLLQGVVEQCFFRGHGLGLDDVLALGLLGNAGNDLVGLPVVGRQVDVHTGSFGLGLELLKEFVHVLHGPVFTPGNIRDQGGNVHLAEGLGPASGIVPGEVVQGLALKVLLQGVFKFLAVFF